MSNINETHAPDDSFVTTNETNSTNETTVIPSQEVDERESSDSLDLSALSG